MDASTTRVGPVLSQQQRAPAAPHPCADFSKKLTQTERNYDIGNCELPAIRLALEEWRHWLDSSKHPFTVLTDHKNLEYLWDGKRLNRCQEHKSRCSLWSPCSQWFVCTHSLEGSLTSSSLSEPVLPVCPPGLSYIPRAQHIPLILSSYIIGHWPYRDQSNPHIAWRSHRDGQEWHRIWEVLSKDAQIALPRRVPAIYQNILFSFSSAFHVCSSLPNVV